MSSSHLPEEIISQILQKTSTKTVARFRCVNKAWNNLLSDASVLNLVNRISNHILIGLYSSTNYLSVYPKKHGVFVNVIENFKVPVEISSSFSTGSTFHLLASCDGLVLSLLDSELFLWNPITHDCIKLPKINFSLCGLGYDSVEDDYKVVVITSIDGLQVFSSKSRSWKFFCNLPVNLNHVRYTKKMASCVNGVLHWLFNGYGPSEKRILCFDLAKRKFGTIQEPVETRRHTLDYLCVFEGCLCLVYYCYGNPGKIWSVWVMNEYGVKESWSKVVEIPCKEGVKPLCFNENGELIYQSDDKKLMMYNQTSGEFKKFFDVASRIIPIVYSENATPILTAPKTTN